MSKINPYVTVNGRNVGSGLPAYIIAEMSANHGHDFERAVKIMEAAQKAGADAIKIQTYTPDTLTIDCDNEYFKIRGTLWEGRNLYDLYGEAYTPWNWQPRLKEVANSIGLDFFSTPFDESAVDFLEEMDVPAHKVASFEMVDLPLLRKIAGTGKPVIMSTGMASLEEIAESLDTLKASGCNDVVLLRCVSAYPAPPEEMNLKTIPFLHEKFGVPVGLSDHTLGSLSAVASIAVGACVVEKHFTLSREGGGPDSAFSMEPDEFQIMVRDIRQVESSLGQVDFSLSAKQKESSVFRRSLFVVRDMAEGEAFTQENVRCIRPGYGLHSRHLPEVMGKKAKSAIVRGTPVSWDILTD